MQCRPTLIEEVLDVTQLPIFIFTGLLANQTQICIHTVPQTLILIYTISCFCLFLFFFVDNHVLISYLIGITVWRME